MVKCFFKCLTSTFKAAMDEQRASLASCSSSVSGGTLNTRIPISTHTVQSTNLTKLLYFSKNTPLTMVKSLCMASSVVKLTRTLQLLLHYWMNTCTSAVFCSCSTSCTVVSKWARMESMDRFCSAAISSTWAHRAAWRALIADRFSSNWTGFPWNPQPQT